MFFEELDLTSSDRIRISAANTRTQSGELTREGRIIENISSIKPETEKQVYGQLSIFEENNIQKLSEGKVDDTILDELDLIITRFPIESVHFFSDRIEFYTFWSIWGHYGKYYLNCLGKPGTSRSGLSLRH